MNDAQTPSTNDEARHDPLSRQAKLQALDLGALRGLGDSLDALVCSIDDPDCEAPALATIEGDQRRTEIVEGDPDAPGPAPGQK